MDLEGSRSAESTPSKKQGARAGLPKHSTPIKAHGSSTPGKSSPGRSASTGRRVPSSPSANSAKRNLDSSLASCASINNTMADLSYSRLSLTPAGKAKVSEFETSTIQKQRQELQLLIAELRDRDKELNNMVASHQRQLRAWEQDRKKILSLEEKCGQLEESVHSRNDDVRQLVARLRVFESEDHNKSTALESAQQHLAQLSEQNSQSALHIEELQVKKQSLNDSVREMSGNIGDLEAREEELISVLQKKDRDLSDANTRIAELSAKLKRVDGHLHESQAQAADLRRQVSEWKNRQLEASREVEHLKRESVKAENHSDMQHLEIQKQKQELNTLRKELMLATEREKRKDQLLQLQKSKQDRSDTELSDLRQLYERQQRDLSLLHLSLESSRELLAKQQGQFAIDRSFLEADISRSSQRSLGRRHSPSSGHRSTGSSLTPTKVEYRYADRYSSPLDKVTLRSMSPHDSPGCSTGPVEVTDLYYASPMHPGTGRVRFSPTTDGCSPGDYSRDRSPKSSWYPSQAVSEPVLPEPRRRYTPAESPSDDQGTVAVAPSGESAKKQQSPSMSRDDQASAHSGPESEEPLSIPVLNITDGQKISEAASTAQKVVDPTRGQSQPLQSPASSERHSAQSRPSSKQTLDSQRMDHAAAIVTGNVSHDGSFTSPRTESTMRSERRSENSPRLDQPGNLQLEHHPDTLVADHSMESAQKVAAWQVSAQFGDPAYQEQTPGEHGSRVAASDAGTAEQTSLIGSDVESFRSHQSVVKSGGSRSGDSQNPPSIHSQGGSQHRQHVSSMSHEPGGELSRCHLPDQSHQYQSSVRSHQSSGSHKSRQSHGDHPNSHQSVTMGHHYDDAATASHRSGSTRSHHSNKGYESRSHQSHHSNREQDTSSTLSHHSVDSVRSHHSASQQSHRSQDVDNMRSHHDSIRSRDSVSQQSHHSVRSQVPISGSHHPDDSIRSHESTSRQSQQSIKNHDPTSGSHHSNDSLRSHQSTSQRSHHSIKNHDHAGSHPPSNGLAAAHDSATQQSHHSDEFNVTPVNVTDVDQAVPEITPYRGRGWVLEDTTDSRGETLPDGLELRGVTDSQLQGERSSTPLTAHITGRELESPATKLHTLLTESQELAKDLERSSLANISQESRELDQSAHRKGGPKPGLTNGNAEQIAGAGTNQNGQGMHSANETTEFELSLVADEVEQEEG